MAQKYWTGKADHRRSPGPHPPGGRTGGHHGHQSNHGRRRHSPVPVQLAGGDGGAHHPPRPRSPVRFRARVRQQPNACRRPGGPAGVLLNGVTAMRLDTSMSQRMEQKMILAPRMIQSMEILQLPVMALQERIEHELQENPVLEMREAGRKDDEEFEAPAAPEPEIDDAARELVIDTK